jgi:hypothetical protein
MFDFNRRPKKLPEDCKTHAPGPVPSVVKLMWDYRCWPLWQHDGQIFDNIDPATVPLSAPTLARLEAWAAIPDAKLEQHIHCPQDISWGVDERQSFEAEGRALWEILRRELGEGYRVVYHSTTEGRVLLPKNAEGIPD